MTTPVSDDISGFFEKNYERIYRYIIGMMRAYTLGKEFAG
jgi:hypothetical protein